MLRDNFRFDAQCTMTQRNRGGKCEECPAESYQSDNGEDCIRVGAQPSSRGATFYGSTVNGLKSGRGETRYAEDMDMVRYVGDFANDQPNGYGEMEYKNGTMYWGEWREGRAEGRGEIQWGQNGTDGKIYYDGEVRNGMP